MTVVTTRPISSVNTGCTVTGSSAHAATNDDSDSTYVTIPSAAGVLELVFPSPTQPSGSLFKRADTALRCVVASGTPTLAVDGAAGSADELVGSFAPPTLTQRVTGPGLVDNEITTIQMACSNGNVRIFEAYIDNVFVGKPVANITSPVGTVTTTNEPAVLWARTLDSDGGPQTKYQVQIVSGSTIVEDSGETVGTAQMWTPNMPLADGSYTAKVRIAQTVNGEQFWSDFATQSFTISVALPHVPLLAVEGDAEQARTVIDLNTITGSATTNWLQVQRSSDAGATWQMIRTLRADGLLTTDELVVFDWEAPLATPLLYRARAGHDYSGELAWSAWTTSSSCSIDTASWWLKHPTRPELNCPVLVTSFPGTTRAARAGVIQALGAEFPIVVSDTRLSRTGTIVFLLPELVDQAAVDALLDTRDTLLLHGPERDAYADSYVQLGDQGRVRLADRSFIHAVQDTYVLTTVAAPAGVLSQWPPPPGS